MSTHNVHFQDKRSRISPNISISAVIKKAKKKKKIHLGTQERVRNSHGNEPSVFELLMCYCTVRHLMFAEFKFHDVMKLTYMYCRRLIWRS